MGPTVSPLAGFMAARLIAANLGVAIALSSRPVLQRLLAPSSLWASWVVLSLQLDPDWWRAGQPGHVLWISAAQFPVLGLPTVIVYFWRKSASSGVS